MKILKEVYGESDYLDNFVSQAEGRFETYYKVKLLHDGKTEERYFYNEDSAREYYDKLVEDAKTEYGWDGADIYLYEVKVDLIEEELENEMIDIVEEDEEEYITSDEIIDDEE